jgi:hypothetical protein
MKNEAARAAFLARREKAIEEASAARTNPSKPEEDSRE